MHTIAPAGKCRGFDPHAICRSRIMAIAKHEDHLHKGDMASDLLPVD